LDKGLGLLLDKLTELGLRRNTLVVFTSDNGAYVRPRKVPEESYERFTGPYRGCKGEVLEQVSGVNNNFFPTTTISFLS
jgi:arylsulfatase A-like enzyme